MPERAERNSWPSLILLDRDGVINRKAPEGCYVTGWEEFEFLPGALDGLRLLGKAGIPVAVVTNQRAVAKGLISESRLIDLHARMVEEITRAGGRVDRVYFCPHDLDAGCTCRKPRVGLLERAADELGGQLVSSVLIGDRLSDIQAAGAVGATSVLIGSDSGEPEARVLADHVANDLRAALGWVLAMGPGGNQ